MPRRLTLSLALLLFLAVAAPGAQAATFQVNDLTDRAAVANACVSVQPCSLREAIAAANGAAGADTVTLPAGTYGLTQGQLPAITGSTTIAGAGARSTVVNGNNASRVFSIEPSNASAVAFTDFTVTGGNALVAAGGTSPGDGGGILVRGDNTTSLALNRMAVRGNSAQMGGGSLAAPPENTGQAASTVSVSGSTFSNNTAGTGAMTDAQGGGMAVFGNLNLTNSTVSDNAANSMATGRGAGIVVSTDTSNTTPVAATLVNSTISNNTASAGAGMVTGAGGVSGVFGTTTVNATNTIVAQNTLNGVETDCSLVSAGAVVSNISGDASCGFTGNGNKPQTSPQLGDLGDHGGPTDTRLLGTASPALNAGTTAGCPGADQRGVARPQAGACDIGAVELALPKVLTGAASRVFSTSAVLTGAVTNPPYGAATVAYELGRTTSYGTRLNSTDVAGGASGVRVARSPKLTPGVTYHYRIVATNRDGRSVGVDRTFKAVKKAGRKPYLKLAAVPKVCRRTSFTLRLRSRVSGTGVTLRSVKVTLDGRTLKTVKKSGRFAIKVDPGALKGGRHTIRVVATDSRRRTTTVVRRFSRCGASKG